MVKEMLIRIDSKDTAIAITDDRQLQEIFLPRSDHQNLIGNIYLGKVENVLPGMQAAFVDIGLEKNSFLYVEDTLPSLCLSGEPLPLAEGKVCSIADMVKPNQEIMVQIFKEPAGTKGARVTMHPSLPGRYVVLLPKGDYIAVSRRIEDEDLRESLKELVRAELPEDMGVIVRTVAADAPPEQVLADLAHLVKKWHRLQGRSVKSSPPHLLYSDFDLLPKVIRDTGAQDIDKIIVENAAAFDQVAEVCEANDMALREKLILRETENLFLDYDIYAQMERALKRKVWLSSGGYIIFDQTEALTVIDVNTGKYVGEDNLAKTVFKTNMEAVSEVARQLKLRNIGGIVIIDFIDMDEEENKKQLLEELNAKLKQDRVRVTVMGMTKLGLVELTRKKIGHDLSSAIEKECPCCQGKGKITIDPQEKQKSNG